MKPHQEIWIPQKKTKKNRKTPGPSGPTKASEQRLLVGAFKLMLVPVSGPLGADPGSLHVRRFSRKSRTRKAVSHCASAEHAPPGRGAWRKPLEKTKKYMGGKLDQIIHKMSTMIFHLFTCI